VQAHLFAVKRLFAQAKGIGLLCLLHAPLDFVLYQSGILEQAQNLLPNKVIEIVLA
jgi:hypothetical protein